MFGLRLRSCLATLGILMAAGVMTQFGAAATIGTYSAVRKGVQKIQSFMFGCPPLVAAGSPPTLIECRNKNSRSASEVDCALKVPLNSAAFFSCPRGHVIEEDYDIVKCIFPGMWDNEIVTCIVDVNATRLAGNSSCVDKNSTTSLAGNTTCLAGNTTALPTVLAGNTTALPTVLAGNTTALPTVLGGNTTTVTNTTTTMTTVAG